MCPKSAYKTTISNPKCVMCQCTRALGAGSFLNYANNVLTKSIKQAEVTAPNSLQLKTDHI